MKCADCKKDTPIEEMVADHIVPLSRGGGHGDDNIQWVHSSCHRNKAKWYYRLWWAIRDWYEGLLLRYQEWVDSFAPCPKEQGGYTCHHRIMSNGKKECGDPQNFWRGGDE